MSYAGFQSVKDIIVAGQKQIYLVIFIYSVSIALNSFIPQLP